MYILSLIIPTSGCKIIPEGHAVLKFNFEGSGPKKFFFTNALILLEFLNF